MDTFNINDRVNIIGKKSTGTIAFIGTTHFSDGLWIGVILDGPNGRNNGSYDGTRYFKCDKNHGIFVRPCQVKKLQVKSSETTRKHYPNYLKCDSSPTPIGKLKNNTDNISPKKKKRDVKLKSITISSETTKDTDPKKEAGENKEKTKDSKIGFIKQLLSQDVESSSKEKGTKFIKANKQDSDLKQMISKTHKELNEVKAYVADLDRKIKLLKEISLKENNL
ncbi:centrosome-associated protein 350 [Trichonephila clavata]|uniref:Centrosome-associated protein 350 n=1 Tax=Trichonephila clavata TaxID=2740835 RepID=A0A8X6KS72_TRICU|nr:centrosome-associated protein 350 [Trichonephila clavata]